VANADGLKETQMSQRERLTDKSSEPTPQVVWAFIGRENAERWGRLLDIIDAKYPGVFRGEWLYGGAKHGWSLRFKKSRSFCTLVPERGRMNVVIVFGAAERDKADEVLPSLVSHVQDDYAAATTYHDGKWVLIDVDSEEVLTDVERLLEVKRRPAKGR
jgi:hypothetical protein